MYEAMFELRRRPFASTVDTESYYASPRHDQALMLLQGCVDSGDGIGVLTGPTGTGKTLLSHLLLETLNSNLATIFVTNTHPTSVAAFYQAMLYDLSIDYGTTDEQTLRLRLMDHVVARFAAGERTLLIVDEAHHLTVDQLEEIRMLTNLEGRQDRAIQVLLIGGDSLLTSLRREELKALRQRISVFARIEPLDPEQTVEYIRSRIARAGGIADTIFTAGALSEVCERSMGVPRVINQICHRAMLNAWQTQSGAIDTLDVVEAAAQLELGDRPEPVIRNAVGSALTKTRNVPHRASAPLPKVDVHESTNFVEVGAGLVKPMQSTSIDSKSPVAEYRLVDSEPDKQRSREKANTSGMSRLRQLYSR